MTSTFKVGDQVRVTQSRTGTLYEIVTIDGFHCTIREAGTQYRPQNFDTSLLKPVVRK